MKKFVDVLKNAVMLVAAPVMYVKYVRGSKKLRGLLPAPDKESKKRRFQREEIARSELDNTVWTSENEARRRYLIDYVAAAERPFDRRLVYRLEGADAQVETFSEYFDAWRMRGLGKAWKKAFRPVKLNYYAHNNELHRPQEVNLMSAIEFSRPRLFDEEEAAYPDTGVTQDANVVDLQAERVERAMKAPLSEASRLADKYITRNGE